MKTIYSLVIGVIFLTAISCKESEQEVQPTSKPPAGGEQPAQKFTLSVKPSTVPTSTSFTAIISALKEDGSVLYTDAPIAMTVVNGTLVSGAIELPAGKYTLTKLLVKDAAQNVVIASPQANSAKANGTVKVLPLAFTEAPLTLQSSNVSETDLPEEFGYASSAFGERPYTKITVKSVLSVGGVQYLPDLLVKITADGWTKEVPNGSEIGVPKKYYNYHFTSSIWNVTASKEVLLETLKLLPVVTLEAYTVPKRIKVEEISTSVPSGGTIVTGRREYSYDQYEQVSEIIYYQKKKNSDELELTMKRTFGFADNQLQTINAFAADGTFIGYSLFWYDKSGRVRQIEEQNYDVKTKATFTYLANGEVEGNYVFNNGNKMTYKMKYANDNKTEDAAFGNGSETGKYHYDNRINPYYFLNYPDLFLSNSSKNNKTAEDKTYGGNIPTLEMYETKYNYDAQGYPDLVIKSYRGFTSKEHVSKQYTEYTYY